MNWKHTARFCLTSFGMDFGVGMLLVALPYAVLARGGDSMSLGVTAALRGAGYAAGCLLLGGLSDRFNRKRLMTVSVACLFLSFAVMSAASSLALLYAAVLFWSVTFGLFWPAVFSWLGDSHEPGDLGRASSAMNVSWSIGGMLGGMFAGWLFTRLAQGVFLVALVPVLVAWGSLCLYACPHRRPRPAETAPRIAGARRILAAALLANLSTMVLFGLTGSVFPEYGMTIGVTPVFFGLLVAAAGLGRTGAFLAGLRWSARMRAWPLVFLVQALAAILVAGLAFVPGPRWLAATFFLTGLAAGICYYRGIYTVLEAPGSRGARAGLFEATLLLGIFLGGFCGGWLAKTRGLAFPYPVVAGFALLLVPVQVSLLASINGDGPARRPVHAWFQRRFFPYR